MTQYIKKLPAVFQTVTEKKFFDATVDQVFSKKDSDLLAGYIGQRIPGQYNPVNDFYLPEPTKDRTWWQLEATAFARNADNTKSNIFFYDDLLDRINYYGGNTLNQDRLFESEYYSWAPPIDFDMFINYQNYYWVDKGLVTINITGMSDAEITAIIGQESFTTPLTASPAGLKFTTGLKVQFVGSTEYPSPLTIENLGNCIGIRLVPQFPDYTSGTILEFLPWDGIIQLANGRVIQNTNWDTSTWDVQAQPGNGDYITIERGSVDQNAWSRTNNWYHIDAINTAVTATNTPFPANASRALRPIIQFSADLILYNSGTQFNADISFGFRDDLFGQPLLKSQFDGHTVVDILTNYDVEMQSGQLVAFLNDTSSNQHVYLANVTLGVVTFTLHSNVINGDILFAIDSAPYNGMKRGQTYYYDINQWVVASNDKVTTNQPPLFQLYDHNGIPLDDINTYPGSTFAGSKIFSYKINTAPGATVDPVLKFPIVYTSLGQASDIVFQNNLITDRYVYGKLPISGYYYYKTSYSPVMYNSWNLYDPSTCTTPMLAISKQRVIDKFVVGYGTLYQFKLSVTPYNYPTAPDLIVSVNGLEVKNATLQTNGYTFDNINNSIYVDLTAYLTALLATTQSQPPVVEIDTYTHGLLNPAANGYFEIPQQLNANPTQQEISEISASNLIQQFSSIIYNQVNFSGIAFGGDNNYRDSYKNRSVGSFILQNVAPALKSMLISSSDDLDFITGIRFSQDEYTKFKNKYLSAAQQLINQEFSPVQYHNNTVVISAWVDAIIKIVNVSKEFSNAFAYSYMIANGTPYTSETHTVPLGGLVTLINYLDLSDQTNALYVYDTSVNEKLLMVGIDYTITSTNLAIELHFNAHVGQSVVISLYKNPLPAYIPSTPTKIGSYGTFIPRIEWDTSYTIPTWVIIGHDGSKTIAYGDYNPLTGVFTDYRDPLLIELETRIYNLLQTKFRSEYHLPLRVESVKSGYYRQTRYSRDEYLAITESYLNKWSAKNKANYRINDWAYASVDPLLNPNDIWKLYNYTTAVDKNAVNLNLHGNWKGIFQCYYDTIFPNTRPWEMLGFTSMPEWWIAEYGAPIINGLGEEAWPYQILYNHMWFDIRDGVIRQGPSAILDPVTLVPQPQAMWARPTILIDNLVPVDSSGNIIPVPTLFGVAVSGNPYAPFDGFDNPWVYGDGAPVEQAWMSTSAYAFSVQEFLYLMKPGPFGELMFDTVGTELSAGMIGTSMSDVNWQYVQNETYTSVDPFFAWMRPKNADQIVHAETLDGVVQIRYGYQRWISDRILFLGKDVGTVFGQKVRTLDVNLANKLAGFTNKDTTTTYLESVSTTAGTTSLLVPTNNFDVVLHKGQPIKTYTYSGVVIRVLADGTFVVYGYDLLNSAFSVLDRSNAQAIDITVGGTPAEYKPYALGETYNAGDIVRYNGIYYQAIGTIVAGKFDITNWQKLRALPTNGGVSVTYRPISETTYKVVPYGSVFTSVQEVFDLLIGWGAYLESEGWEFTDVSADTNQVSDWLYSAKQFLFWLNTNWAPDASIQVSPAANNVMLTVQTGYPDDVESISNGVYSVLDKFGVAIPPNSTSTNRDGMSIAVSPVDLGTGGIYFLQVNASETEHILIFDNETSFADVIYDPLLRVRQQRLRFNGFRSNGWYGKAEAPGYLIMNNQLVPNFDTIVDSMRYYYDPDVTIDNPSLESLGRHLIGYESKSYLDNLQLSNDVQYLFYQGAIRQKGTIQSLDKLFRSTKVQSSEIIEVYEEWALKLGDFGNTIEQVSTEFILQPEQNTGEVIVARLNFIPSTIGMVRAIDIVNAENTYVNVPKIIISAPDADITNTRQAKAYAVLNSAGIISRVDITDPGYGYLSAPYITIDSGTEPHQLDKLYAVWQGEIYKDPALDNIVEIDIDNTDMWTVRPQNPSYSLVFPTTDVIEYSTPNAGYVNFNDVKFTSFDPIQSAVLWGTPSLNPVENDTLWVAKNFIEDWNVYKMVSIGAVTWSVVEDPAGSLVLLTDLATPIVPQLSTDIGANTDFGNMICLQIVADGAVAGITNYAVTFAPYGEPNTYTGYNSYSLLTLDGVPITSTEIGVYADLTTLLLFKTMRFDTTPTLPSYVVSGDKIWVDDVNGLWTVFDYTTTLTAFRVQEKLIDTKLFESAQIFQTRTQTELVLLPIYDPFKDILPALAKQNITYMLLQDPARYNVTGDVRLFSDNITFGPAQVGKLWWDLSTVRYAYYEQPIALDGSESLTDNLVYRRDRWGQTFPGSIINMYEWTKSSVPPLQYVGTGTPRDTTSYVQIITSNRFTNITEVNYYFWVLNPTSLPNIENRTMAALDVARLLASPKSQDFTFFCPVQQTANNNSYIFYNVQEILAYQGNNIQIQYRLAVRDDQKHTQWKFFREGDKNSLVTDQYWDKFVDSICAYTKLLPVTNEWTNSILIAKDLPWDIYGWDIAPWDDAVDTNHEIYGEILPVPDPALGEAEKYGITYRPRQGMFVNLSAARKIFVQSGNNLLKHIPIRDNNPTWNAGVQTSVYWNYTNWYEIGFENAVPNVVFSTLSAANVALIAGQFNNGTIVEVINGTTDGRFALYNVVQLNANVSTQSFQLVGIEASAINLLNTIYTTNNVYGLSTELRELLNAFRTQVMVDSFVVDQNELYFSMLNYVLSEQKNPDWLFKTSYLYIKENNIPLTQSALYMPDQINNIINYIVDAKPYHTQIRDYTSTYLTSDIAVGTATDGVKDEFGNSDGSFVKKNITIQFGPGFGGPYEPAPWDMPCDSIENITPVDALWGDAPWGTESWGDISTSPVQEWDTVAWDVCPDNYSYLLNAGTLSESVNQYTAGEYVIIWNPLDTYTIHQIIDYTDVLHPEFSGVYNVQADTLIGENPYNNPNKFLLWSSPYVSVPLQTPTPAEYVTLQGLSTLIPYILDVNSINEHNPQTFITPADVVSVTIGNTVLNYGQDYYVGDNGSGSYTVYFYENPPASPTPVANVLWDGGSLTRFRYGSNRTEIAYGIGRDNFVVNVDTKLPVNNVGSILYPYAPWGSSTTGVDPIIASLIVAAGGSPTYNPVVGTLEYLPGAVISYKENLGIGHSDYYRNNEACSGTLVLALPEPTQYSENVDSITVTSTSDIFPAPSGSVHPAVWINGERITYGLKTVINATTWELSQLHRGTNGTAPDAHIVSSLVWSESYNALIFFPAPTPYDVGPYDMTEWDSDGSSPSNPGIRVWNATDEVPDVSTQVGPSKYTSIQAVSQGGLWYAATLQSQFLKEGQGQAIP